MVVWIEYALAENFIMDASLLYLSCRVTKTPVRVRRLCFAALCGGGFALAYPLLRLPAFLLWALRIAVGALLCLLCAGGKRNAGRCALQTLCFFFLTFACAGTAYALPAPLSPVTAAASLALLACLTERLTRSIYRRRAVHTLVYDCVAIGKEKRVPTTGFYDSGNFAQKDGTPVCFVAPDLIFDLFSDAILGISGGQVCDELAVATLNGEKKHRLYKGELEIENALGARIKKSVYFAPSAHMLSREYKLLLPSRIFEADGEDTERKVRI